MSNNNHVDINPFLKLGSSDFTLARCIQVHIILDSRVLHLKTDFISKPIGVFLLLFFTLPKGKCKQKSIIAVHLWRKTAGLILRLQSATEARPFLVFLSNSGENGLTGYKINRQGWRYGSTVNRECIGSHPEKLLECIGSRGWSVLAADNDLRSGRVFLPIIHWIHKRVTGIRNKLCWAVSTRIWCHGNQ